MVLNLVTRVLASLILIILFSPDLCALDKASLDKKLVKEVNKIFDTELEIKPIATLQESDQVYLIQTPEKVLGYVLSTSAKGRYDNFDYSVIYNPELGVKSVVVTTYRSSHGAGICSKGWLKQFRGYHGEEIRLGKEIDSISGATISASSLVEDIQRGYKQMEELVKTL